MARKIRMTLAVDHSMKNQSERKKLLNSVIRHSKYDYIYKKNIDCFQMVKSLYLYVDFTVFYYIINPYRIFFRILCFHIFYKKNKVSRIVRKPDFCLGENKGADQLRGNREADQRLCFRYTESTLPLLLKSEISSF